ncbi:MAG: pyruvate dehydrogenase (acetyl-transferring) E1 component subunit alpha [Alphaproteobacteria bacterium]
MNSKVNNQNKQQLLKLYEDMLLIRRFEEKSGQLYGMGLIAGFCHLYIGQEAVVVGIQSMQKENDTIITAYRDHGHMLACGMPANGIMAELTGRIGGVSKGKGGSMHMFSREKNFFGGHGIVGAQVPLGTGMAFAHKYKNTGAISVTYMGDGASNQGQVAEAYNMAALWKLPVLYVVENNQYSMGTAVARHTTTKDLYTRGEPYGIPGEKVNGMDIFEVQRAAKRAFDHIRSGKGPYILEMDTYRYRGHSMSDPAKYRTKEEVETYRATNDPLTNMESILLAEKICTAADFEQVAERVKDAIKESAEFAQNSPEPDASELYTDVLIEN